MYWMLFPGTLPTPVELSTGGLPALAALLTACAPAWLLIRQLLSRRAVQREVPPLPVVSEVAEADRHAA